MSWIISLKYDGGLCVRVEVVSYQCLHFDNRVQASAHFSAAVGSEMTVK